MQRHWITGAAHADSKSGKISVAMADEFTERDDELEPQADSSLSGVPPGKAARVGVVHPQSCPQCGQRFPSEVEESAMRKTRAKDPDEWENLRQKISCKVCTCLEPKST